MSWVRGQMDFAGREVFGTHVHHHASAGDDPVLEVENAMRLGSGCRGASDPQTDRFFQQFICGFWTGDRFILSVAHLSIPAYEHVDSGVGFKCQRQVDRSVRKSFVVAHPIDDLTWFCGRRNRLKE